MGDKHIELRSEMSEIARLSEEIESFGAKHDFSPEAVFQLNLALEEAVTNVISYGFDDGAEHVVKVVLSYDGRRLKARIEDDGVAYDPLAAPPPDLEASVEDRKVGGLGIHLVRELMDEVSYERSGERNVLTMSKQLGGE